MSRVIFEAKLDGETVTEIFDFTSRLAAGETISTAIVSAITFSGTDATPSAIVTGSATISGQKVTQRITAGTEGVTYLLVCTITTSASQTLELSGYLAVVEEQQ